MHYTIAHADQTILITCTQQELDEMDWLRQRVYGTPNADAPGELAMGKL